MMTRMKLLANNALEYLKRNAIELTTAFFVGALGLFLYLRNLNSISPQWMNAYLAAAKQGLYASFGNGLLGLQPFYMAGADVSWLVEQTITTATLIILYISFALKISGQNKPYVVFLLFDLVGAFLFFAPQNRVLFFGSSYLCLSALTLCATLAFLKTTETNAAIRPFRTAIMAISGLLIQVLFGSLLSLFVLIGFGVAFAVKDIKNRQVDGREKHIVLVSCLVGLLVHYAIYWFNGIQLNPYSSVSFDIGTFFANFAISFSPNPLNGSSNWQSSAVPIAVLGKALDLMSIVVGGCTLLITVSGVVFFLVRKKTEKSFLPFALLGLICFAFLNSFFVTLSLGRAFDVSNLLVFCGCAYFIAEASSLFKKEKNVQQRFDLKAYLEPALLCLAAIVFSLGGFAAPSLDPSFNKAEYYELMLTAKPEDIKVYSNGMSCLGSDPATSYEFASLMRKHQYGLFRDAIVPRDFYDASCSYDSNGHPTFKEADQDHWIGENFRVLLNSGYSKCLSFWWYITDEQLGGSISVYLDGKLAAIQAADGNLNHLEIPTPEQNVNYFIAIHYDIPAYNELDSRDLNFCLLHLKFD